MKKEYINPELEVIKIATTMQMLAGSLPKNTEGVDEESDVLMPGLLIGDF